MSIRETKESTLALEEKLFKCNSILPQIVWVNDFSEKYIYSECRKKIKKHIIAILLMLEMILTVHMVYANISKMIFMIL